MVHRLEELPVFSKTRAFSEAVSETVRRSSLRKNSKLYEQNEEANDSILPNMDEGFERSTDDGVAKYLVYSKGSVAEVMRRLRVHQVPEELRLYGSGCGHRKHAAPKQGFGIQGFPIQDSRFEIKD